MTEVHVAYENGAHRCYVTETGLDRRYIGCGHVVPRSAIEHADALDHRHTQAAGLDGGWGRPPADVPAARMPEKAGGTDSHADALAARSADDHPNERTGAVPRPSEPPEPASRGGSRSLPTVPPPSAVGSLTLWSER